ncbi:MAG: hypothetical protein AAF936_07650 [Pseudomonadota bacterium]
MSELLFSTGIASIGSALVISFVIWLGRNWFTSKIVKGVEHRFDIKLEEFKSKLSAQTSRELSVHGAAVSAQMLGAEKRIEAIQKLWNSICKIRNRDYRPFALLSFLTEDEYIERITSGDPEYAIPDSKEEAFKYIKFTESLNLEELRPFITQKLWQLYFVYRAIAGRLIFLEGQCSNGRSECIWYRDEHIRHILAYALTAEQIKDTTTQTFKDPAKVIDAVEWQILSEMHKIANGEMFGHESAKLAVSLQDIMQTARLKS